MVAVTKDVKSNPRLVYVVVQLTSSENPSVNLMGGINYLAEKYEDLDNSTIYSMEELERILSTGELFYFGFSKNSYPSDISNKVIEQIYSGADYVEALVSFAESQGENIKTDLFIIFPHIY